MKKLDFLVFSVCWGAAMDAFKLVERIAPQLKIVPLNAISEAKGTHCCRNIVASLIPYRMHKRDIIIWNGLHNIYVFYNPFGDDISLLQLINQFLMSANLLISFAQDSNHSASIFFSLGICNWDQLMMVGMRLWVVLSYFWSIYFQRRLTWPSYLLSWHMVEYMVLHLLGSILTYRCCSTHWDHIPLSSLLH